MTILRLNVSVRGERKVTIDREYTPPKGQFLFRFLENHLEVKYCCLLVQ